eukprot:TRINITY_DN50593_c0_g1_i1.p1 TRINITY_DN50593_c0_g1~~TRINITY_DN50593_c0_g1_i1.p1  ORF type:complete len:421 (-),score=89.00 TRINITY_DN50593_c0_g1_i1:82-1344(-)
MGVEEVAPQSKESPPAAAAEAPAQEIREITPEQAAASQASSASPGSSQDVVITRLHILPFVETDAKLQSQSPAVGRIQFMANELRRIRGDKEVVTSGSIVRIEDSATVVIKCEPPEGILSKDTDFFVDGNPVVQFEKVQFSVWGQEALSSEDLFPKIVKPFLKGEYSPFGSESCKKVRLMYSSQVIQVGEYWLQVEATEPSGLGVVSIDTEIFTNWDETPEFSKIHILPFQDTIPRAYSFNLFEDYLRPFLRSNINRKFQANELFSYQGVQFKVVACEPNDVPARISRATTVYCEGVLNPSLRNLLPAHLLNQVSQLPPGLQMLLLNTERTTRELEDMLTARRGLFDSTLEEIPRFNWPPKESVSQTSCMVCLCDFELADECRRLPCGHVFHTQCVDEWLRRCTDCPICKANVDRAIRNY